MADALEYVVNTALMHCNKGVAMLPFSATINTTIHIQKQLVGTEMDKAPLVNIPSFGMCSITKSPCVPVPTIWQETYEFVKVKGFKPLLFQSCMLCGAGPGGKIEFLTSGQLPLADSVTPESMEQIEEANKQSEEAVAEYEAQKDAVGESGIIEGFIPVWGSGRDAVNAFQTGHWGWGIFHSVMVVVDVVTLGGGTIVKGAIKGGIKAATKAAVKGLSKKAAAALAAKQAAVNLLKQSGKQMAEFSVKRLGICITKACFVAGTPVATKDGLKNIEDILFGDEVWAYDEKTGEIGLKEVVNVFEKEVDSLIELTIEGELVTTTTEHPFYANGEFKEAGLLETGDNILLFSGRFAKVEKVLPVLEKVFEEASEQSDVEDHVNKKIISQTKVYNLEIKGWNTYFVGILNFLVHNATCIYTLASQGVKWAQDIVRGIAFNAKMNAQMLKLAEEKGLKYFSETWLKKGGKLYSRVDGYIPGKAIIERKATDLSKIDPKTAKSYIDQLSNKYKEGMEIANKTKGEVLEGKKILQVDKIGDVSQEVLDHAAKKGVKIVESSEDIFKVVGL
jgi:regulator of RNase E activity RraB